MATAEALHQNDSAEAGRPSRQESGSAQGPGTPAAASLPAQALPGILGHAQMARSANAPVRAVSLKRVQQSHGNRAVQRMLGGPRGASAPRVVQRECACAGNGCTACAQEALAPPLEETRVLQREAAPGQETAPETRRGDEAAPDVRAGEAEEPVIPEGSPGEPLPEETRAFMEERLGRDFGQVRVHTDAKAADAAEDLGANAFTTGRDVYFAAGQYAPATAEGQRLIAHELAHTVQQGEGRTPTEAQPQAHRGVLVGAAHDPLEGEADRAADAAMAGEGQAALSPDASGAVRRDVGDTLGAAWNATGGRAVRYVGGKARAAVRAGKELIADQIRKYAPGLMEFLESDLVQDLKDRIAGGFDSLFGGVAELVQKEGLLGAARAIVGGLVTRVSRAVSSITGGGLAGAARALVEMGEKVAGDTFDKLKSTAQSVGAFLSGLWDKTAGAAWNVIQSIAGAAFKWIKSKAKWVWDKVSFVVSKVETAWNWIKRQFGITGGGGEGGILDWLKEKAIAGWEALKATVKPILDAVKTAGAAFKTISPLTPILLVGRGLSFLWDALKWIAEHWEKDDLLVASQAVLRDRILPLIQAGAAAAAGFLTSAATWIAERAAAVAKLVGKLTGALSGESLLALAQSAVTTVASKVTELVTWAKDAFSRLMNGAKDALKRFWDFLKPILIAVTKFLIVAANPLLWPIYISAWWWKVLPDRFKPPVLDWVIGLMISAIDAMPDFKSFGETWAEVKSALLQALRGLQAKPMEEKVAVSNRIADMIVGGTLEGYSNLIDAARQMPDHFVGQASEELLGMNLGAPLPFERTRPRDESEAAAANAAAGVEEGALTPADQALLDKPFLDDGDIAMSEIAALDLEPELFRSLRLTDGGAVTFGESSDPANTAAALREELASGGGADPAAVPAPAAGAPAAGTPATSPAAVPETGADEATGEGGGAGEEEPAAAPLTPEEELEELINQETPVECGDRPEPAGGPAAIPESAKKGPFTVAQRGRYLWSQLKKGLRNWYECNKTAIWIGIIVAVVLIIVDLIFTGGATTTAIFDVITVIMLGIAAIRMAGYVAAYMAKALLGDIVGAAKSLARALAVGAVELVFALIGGAKGFLKSLKSGARTIANTARATGRALAGTGRALGRGGRALATTARTGLGGLARATAATGRAAAGRAAAVGRAVLKNGKIVFQGLKSGFSRGARSLDDLARRLWSRLRFRRFKLERHGRYVQLWGYINPWVLLANGSIDWVDDVGKAKAGEKYADDLIEGIVVRGSKTKPDYRHIMDVAKSASISKSSVIHHAIEQQVLKRFKSLFTLAEIHAATNLRQIARGVFNSEVHLSKIRTLWNGFYNALEGSPKLLANRAAARAAFRDFAATVDTYIEGMARFARDDAAFKAAMEAGDTVRARALLADESARLLKTVDPSAPVKRALATAGG